MRLISRNLWINNNHGGWHLQGVALTRNIPNWFWLQSNLQPAARVGDSQSTHSWLDCITHCCNSLPTSFTEMNQLIFHKKLIVCLWINNHFNYIPMWTLHHMLCSIVFFIRSVIGSHTICKLPLLFAHVLSSPADVSNVIIITAPAPALSPATVRSYYHYHV